MNYYEEKLRGLKIAVTVALIAIITLGIGDALITGGVNGFVDKNTGLGDYAIYDDENPFGLEEEEADEGQQDAEAQDNPDNGEAEEYSADNVPADLVMYKSLSDEDKQIYQAIYKAVTNLEPCEYECDIEKGDEYMARLDKIYQCYVLADNPQIFWVHPFYNYGYEPSGGGKAKAFLDLEYLLNKEEVNAYSKQINEKIDSAVSGLNFETDFDKAKWAYDWLCDNVEYNYEAAYGKEDIENEWLIRRCWGAFLQGTTVCEGYAKAFQMLMYKLGVPCTTVTGTVEGEGHAWNVACIGGINAHFDPTWGDQNGFIDYSFFGQSEEQIRADKKDKWETSVWPECTSTEIFDRANDGRLMNSKNIYLENQMRKDYLGSLDPDDASNQHIFN